ncbi:E3 ubiquitin-protein ligase MARCHF11-like isoform X2 [Cuculus canorus]|uniref:E3 ubiquitin-protein ligase MARCHF11-like isoform X2 n=1 Tax=Cuculus canorus TaxID=55661 RepID=UPI0023AB4345|nr:E3 ubiquitin-protein ligase MARCHF11-like isoform X2 [Cuculus canorus]
MGSVAPAPPPPPPGIKHAAGASDRVSLLFQSPLEAALGAGAPMGVVRDLSRGAGGPSQGAARARGGDAGGPGRLAPSPGLVVAAVKPGPAGSRFDKSRGACPSFISLF